MWLANLGFSTDTWLGNAVSQDTTYQTAAPVTYLNNAAGGTNTTTVTTGNSGGTSGQALSAVTGSPAFSSTDTYPPSPLAYQFTVSASAAYLTWNLPASIGAGQTIWLRSYVYFSGSVFAAILMSTDGVWYECLSNGTSFQVRAVPGAAVTVVAAAANTWYRLEMQVNFSVGSATLNVYDTNGNLLGAGTSTGGTFPSTAHAYYGPFQSATGTAYMANLGLTSSTWLGGVSNTVAATAALAFTSAIANGASASLTMTVAGAAAGAPVRLGVPAAFNAGLVAYGFVSAAGTVTVVIANLSGASVTPGTISVTAEVG